jgi:thiol-disulfide isomerase/thioredoxin
VIAGVIALVVAIALFTVLFQGAGSNNAVKPFDQLVFVTQDGSKATLADHKGQPLVVNFFASWCAPCRAELPAIEKVSQAGGGRVQVLGVNSDLDESTWRSFVAQTSITYPTVFQPDKSIWSSLGLSFMPSTVLINPDGTVAIKYTGLITEDKLRSLIDEHFGMDL